MSGGVNARRSVALHKTFVTGLLEEQQARNESLGHAISFSISFNGYLLSCDLLAYWGVCRINHTPSRS